MERSMLPISSRPSGIRPPSSYKRQFGSTNRMTMRPSVAIEPSSAESQRSYYQPPLQINSTGSRSRFGMTALGRQSLFGGRPNAFSSARKSIVKPGGIFGMTPQHNR